MNTRDIIEALEKSNELLFNKYGDCVQWHTNRRLARLLADPGEEPPYKVVLDPGDDEFTIEGPTAVSEGFLSRGQADLMCARLNAAVQYGRSSSLPQVPVDIEGEARKWKCQEHGLDYELNRNSDFPFSVEETASFAKYMLSLSAPAGEEQERGEGDVPKTEPALSAVSPAAQEDAAPIAIAPARRPSEQEIERAALDFAAEPFGDGDVTFNLERHEHFRAAMKYALESTNLFHAPPIANAWIPVSERLPLDYQSVMVHYIDADRPVLDIWTFDHGNKMWRDGTITHWQPLPSPPSPPAL